MTDRLFVFKISLTKQNALFIIVQSVKKCRYHERMLQMKTIKSLMNALLLIGILALGIMLAIQTATLYEEQRAHSKTQEELANMSQQHRELGRELDRSQERLSHLEPVVEWMRSIYDLENMSEEQLHKAAEIAQETPLDFEGALSLVRYADLYEIDYSLVLAVIEIESNFNRNLVGTSQDRGYMQIIPGTEQFLAERYGEELGLTYNPDRIFEPEYNIALGIKYLDELIGVHGNQLDKILSEYNRGPFGLEQYYAAHQTYETTYSRSVISRTPKYIALNDKDE